MTSPIEIIRKDGASRILGYLSRNPELSHGEYELGADQNKREANPELVTSLQLAVERQGPHNTYVSKPKVTDIETGIRIEPHWPGAKRQYKNY
jgi:hypothetical protein